MNRTLQLSKRFKNMLRRETLKYLDIQNQNKSKINLTNNKKGASQDKNHILMGWENKSRQGNTKGNLLFYYNFYVGQFQISFKYSTTTKIIKLSYRHHSGFGAQIVWHSSSLRGRDLVNLHRRVLQSHFVHQRFCFGTKRTHCSGVHNNALLLDLFINDVASVVVVWSKGVAHCTFLCLLLFIYLL